MGMLLSAGSTPAAGPCIAAGQGELLITMMATAPAAAVAAIVLYKVLRFHRSRSSRTATLPLSWAMRAFLGAGCERAVMGATIAGVGERVAVLGLLSDDRKSRGPSSSPPTLMKRADAVILPR